RYILSFVLFWFYSHFKGLSMFFQYIFVKNYVGNFLYFAYINFTLTYTYDVIEPFPHIELDGGEQGKSQHVNNWIKAIPNAKLYIYAGNGRNDILAMKKVLEQP